MLKFLIIFLTWIVPGILLFLYLVWISKRFAPKRDQLDAPTTQPGSSHVPETDLFADEVLQPDRRDFKHSDAVR